jgi:ribosomal protein S9
VSCSRKISFATSTVVPAAEGTVKVKKDNNNNYAIKVDVRNLAEPNRLPQPQNVYVVWIETERNGTQNLGQLNTSSGLFSNALKASLETVTAYKPIRLFITGENEANVTYPGNYVVLNTTTF